MNQKKVKTGFLLLMLGVGYIHAQEAVPAAGGGSSGSNGEMSYSIGQVVYSANSSSSGSINQGVQQPYDISTSSTKEEVENIKLSVFPNPTNDKLKLNIEKVDFLGYSYELYSVQGKIIKKEDINSTLIEIPMHNLDASTYILKVRSKDAVVKTFRVVKN